MKIAFHQLSVCRYPLVWLGSVSGLFNVKSCLYNNGNFVGNIFKRVKSYLFTHN